MDDFSEGKGYLQAAMNLKDATLRDVALQQALAASKAEKDLDVFMKTATALAQNEKDPSKQATLYQSIAIENLKIGRFYEAIRLYSKILENSRFPEGERTKALEETLNLALSLKDFSVLKKTMKHPLFASVSADTKSRISSQITDLIRSPLPLDSDFVTYALSGSNADSILSSLFFNQGRLPPKLLKQVQAKVNQSCESNPSQGFCRFPSLEKLEPSLQSFLSSVSKSPPKLESVEGLAAQFSELTQQYQSLDNSGDALLDFLCSIRQQKAFMSFYGFLVKVAEANSDLKDVILSKAKESQEAAFSLKQRCLSIAKQSDLVRNYSDDCESLPLKPVSQYLSGGGSIAVQTQTGDPNDNESIKLRKKIFAQPENPDLFLELAYHAYENGFLNSAAATALTGISLYSAQASEFRAVLGCAVYRLGLQNEGKYHLETASSWKGLKQSCTRL
jgi:tetratricopeptide (TPR) repeat protein